MNKRAFIARLKARLRGLSRREVDDRISFYLEAIDDRIEEGMSEDAAVEAVGDVDVIAEQIRADIGAKVGDDYNKKNWKAWEIVLVALGSPLWASLLLAALAIVLSIYIVVWAVNLTLWAVELPFFILSYVSKYLFIACKYLSKKTAHLSLWGIEKIKKLFSFK